MFPAPLKAVFVTLLLSTICALLDSALHTELVVSQAHARIGRPLTPLSFAGVARRTTRRAIIATSINNAPQYSLTITEWSTDVEPPADAFSFTAPDGAEPLDPNALLELDELPVPQEQGAQTGDER